MPARAGGAAAVALVLSLVPLGAGAAAADEHDAPLATRLTAEPAAKTVAVTASVGEADLGGAGYCEYPFPAFNPVWAAYGYVQCVRQGLLHPPPQVYPAPAAGGARTYELRAVLREASSGAPVADAAVVFRLSSGQVLEARTDPTGWARAVGQDWTDEDRYTATFAGTARHLTSTSSAPMTGPRVCTSGDASRCAALPG